MRKRERESVCVCVCVCNVQNGYDGSVVYDIMKSFFFSFLFFIFVRKRARKL